MSVEFPMRGNRAVMVGIYKITSPSGKVYIGQSWDIFKRWMAYKRPGCLPYNQPRLAESLAAHGHENHVFEITCWFSAGCNQDDLDRVEQEQIQTNKAKGVALLNIRGGGSRGKIAPETGRKISEAKKGRPCSDATKLKISNTLKSYVVPRDVRARMAKTLRERTERTPKEKAASEALKVTYKGRDLGDEWRANVSKGMMGVGKGRRLSDETKAKIGAGNRGKKRAKKQTSSSTAPPTPQRSNESGQLRLWVEEGKQRGNQGRLGS